VYLVDPDLADVLPIEVWWQAALLAHGPTSCLVGRSAARAHSAEGLPQRDDEIDLAVVDTGSRHRRATRRETGVVERPLDGPIVVVRQWPVREHEIVVRRGFRMRDTVPAVVEAGCSRIASRRCVCSTGC
jgi:hypothetical protein